MTGDVGTSFATPLVVHSLTGLAAALGRGRATSSTLRAFAVHFAEAHESASLDEVGFGRMLERYDDIWQCVERSVTLLYEDSLLRDQAVAVPLPWPDSATRGNVALRWTLAFGTATDPTDAVDYTRSGIEITFRPHARRWPFIEAGSGRALGVVNLDDAAAVNKMLARGGQPGAYAATRSPERVFDPEGARRDAGKWETTIHQRDRLRASSLYRPELNLAYLARDAGLLVSENVPPLEYSLCVSISGPEGLYDAVRQQYQVLAPLRPTVPIQVRV